MRTTAAVLRAVTDRRPYTESRPLSLEEVELGAPRACELLVRIAAAVVCHSDISVVDGSRVRPLPMALGHEASASLVDWGRLQIKLQLFYSRASFSARSSGAFGKRIEACSSFT